MVASPNVPVALVVRYPSSMSRFCSSVTASPLSPSFNVLDESIAFFDGASSAYSACCVV